MRDGSWRALTIEQATGFARYAKSKGATDIITETSDRFPGFVVNFKAADPLLIMSAFMETAEKEESMTSENAVEERQTIKGGESNGEDILVDNNAGVGCVGHALYGASLGIEAFAEVDAFAFTKQKDGGDVVADFVITLATGQDVLVSVRDLAAATAD